jgi:hypothetical protein
VPSVEQSGRSLVWNTSALRGMQVRILPTALARPYVNLVDRTPDTGVVAGSNPVGRTRCNERPKRPLKRSGKICVP